MTDICRLCASLKKLEQLIPIKDPTNFITVKLKICCQLELPCSNDELLPQNVCQDCIKSLNTSWLFSEKVKQAQDTLKQAFIIDFSNDLNHHNHADGELKQEKHLPVPSAIQLQQISLPESSTFVDLFPNNQPFTNVSESQIEENITQQTNKTKTPPEQTFKIRSIIISLHLKGFSTKYICDRLNLENKTVTDWIRKYEQCNNKSNNQEEIICITSTINNTIVTNTATTTNVTCLEVNHNSTSIILSPSSSNTSESSSTSSNSSSSPSSSRSPSPVPSVTSATESLSSYVSFFDEENVQETMESEANQQTFKMDCEYGDYATVSTLQISQPISVPQKTEIYPDRNQNNLNMDGFNDSEEESEEELEEINENDNNEYLDDKNDQEESSEIIEQCLNEENIVKINCDNKEENKTNEIINYCGNNEEIMADEQKTITTNDKTIKFKQIDKNKDGTVTEIGLKKFPDSWKQYPWDCCYCRIRFTNVAELRTHFNVEHPTNDLQYLCIDCFDISTKYSSFIEHVQFKHRTYLKYCCDICSKFFWNKFRLDEHRRNQHDIVRERKHLCGICNKLFFTLNSLEIHQQRCHLSNEDKNKFKCDICFKQFGTKTNLATHKRIHAGVRNYSCEQCGRSFVQKCNLEKHMIIHMSNKPYGCDVCKKTFKTDLRLIKHKTVHTGLKPHKCNICEREFREKGTLREHYRIHTGDMPFSCEFCDKRFRFKGVLTTHRRQHTGERPYSCVECNHHFTNWPNYNKHMKRKHGINTSVTVRKPQKIPPSGMPAKAKLNHIVPTDHNVILRECSMEHSDKCADDSDEVIVGSVDEKNECEIEQEQNFVSTTSSTLEVEQEIHRGGDIVNDCDGSNSDHYIRASNNITTTGTNSIISNELLNPQNHQTPHHSNNNNQTIILAPVQQQHQHLHAQHTHQQIQATNTQQYSYIPAGTTTMIGFYNLPTVNVELLHQ